MGLPLSGRVFLDGRRVHRGCQCDCLASRGTQNLEIAGPSKPSGDRSPDRLLVRGAERVIFKIRSPMFTAEALHFVKTVLTARLTSHSPSALVKRSPIRSCSGKMATGSADAGRLRFGRSMDPDEV